VSLGFGTGIPGRTVPVPLTLEGSGGRDVRRVVSRLRFKPAEMTFVRFEKASLLDASSGVEFSTHVQEGPDPKAPADGEARTEHALEVIVASPAKPLPDGILGFVVFRIDEKVVPDRTPELVLAHDASIFTGDAAATLATSSEQAKILVGTKDVPVIACFFFMH
jgi:hypothetical protein